MVVEYTGTAIAPNGRRYQPGADELAAPFVDPPEVVRARGERVEGAVPTINGDGEAEWTEGGGGESVSVPTADEITTDTSGFQQIAGADVQAALDSVDNVLGTQATSIATANSNASTALTAAQAAGSSHSVAAVANFSLEAGQLPNDGTDTPMSYTSSVIRNVANGEITISSNDVVIAPGEYLVSYSAPLNQDYGSLNDTKMWVHLSPFNAGALMGTQGSAPRPLITLGATQYLRVTSATHLRPSAKYVTASGGAGQISATLSIVKVG